MKVIPTNGLLPALQAPRLASQDSGTGTASFTGYLQSALNQVNNYQLEAEAAARLLAAGQIEDVHQVTIAAEKANLSLQLTVQIRNKLIEAYQEIMRMQV